MSSVLQISTNIKFQIDSSVLSQLSKVNYSRWVPRLIKNELNHFKALFEKI